MINFKKCSQAFFRRLKVSLFFFLFFFFFFQQNLIAQSTLLTPTECNMALVGVGKVIDDVDGQLSTIISGSNNLDNIIDGDLSNATTFNSVANLLSNKSIVSVKDMEHYYPAGTRAGFVIKSSAGLIDLDLINGYMIRTYRNNVLQESITSTNLSVVRMARWGDRQRVSFVTSLPFDEVELVETTLLSVASVLSVYYAYVEPANACDYNCSVPLTSSNASASAATEGVCLLCSVTSPASIVDNSSSTYATISIPIGVAGAEKAVIQTNNTYPGGTYVGFIMGTGTGLLSLQALGGIRINTYNGTTLQDTRTLNSLVNVKVLSTTTQQFGFVTTQDFNRVELVVSNLLSALLTVRVYSALIGNITDTDADGFPDCVDGCAGSPDYLDYNGNGVPDGCDPQCALDLGLDVNLPANQTTYDFSSLNLGAGLTWSVLAGSPAGASVNTSGQVTGMTSLGTYRIRVTNGTCSDTVSIVRREALNVPLCDIPIIGSSVKVFTPAGQTCLLCVGGTSGDTDNVIDGDLSNYVVSGSLASVLDFSNPLIGVMDTLNTFPAGTRTGFVIEPLGSLISANLLSGLNIRTYNNGIQVESFTASSLVLSAAVIGDFGNLQRISFVATQPFDAVVLYADNVLSALTGLRVYYAFQEPSGYCDATQADCAEMMTADSRFNAQLEMDNYHTGISDALCVGCSITGLSNLIDSDETNYATITRTVGVASVASVAIKSDEEIAPNVNIAGFVIGSPSNLLSVSVLEGMTINTYLNGTLAQSIPVNGGLVNLTLLSETDNKIKVSFTPTAAFNEIQLSLGSLAAVIHTLHVYGAFVSPDVDGDGVPDCIDKCILGPDYLNNITPGIPDACNVVLADDASCVSQSVTFTISGPGLSDNQTYALYEGDNQVGIFNQNEVSTTTSLSGKYTYELRASNDNTTYYPLDSTVLVVHPARASWSANPTDSVWSKSSNWVAGDAGTGGYPIWCTDVSIPAATTTYPFVAENDACRDIHFESGASVGNITVLKYRHAYVDQLYPRNQWVMVSAPLKYMYSADYGADFDNWDNAISPKIFMRYFDVKYSTSGKVNPDNVAGTSSGNFSRAFATMSEELTSSVGFAIWINGSEYGNDNFGDTAPYQFPRRNADTTDVRFSYHDKDGNWAGTPFYLPRGNDIKDEAEWTATSVPDKDNRFRFIFEELMDEEDRSLVFALEMDAGTTIMVGNPFMSHFDFAKFYEDNSGKIHNYFRIWDGDQFYSYVPGGTAAFTGLDGITAGTDNAVSQYIAPMQSFFVETIGTERTNIVFTPDVSVSKVNNELKSAKKESDILRLHITSGQKTGHAIVAASENASDNYVAGEDIFKLFSSMSSVPEIYTIADRTALEINLVNTEKQEQYIPVGIKTSAIGAMELSVSGMEGFTAYKEAYISDLVDGKLYNLKETDVIPFVKTNAENLEGRFYIYLKNAGIVTDMDENNDLSNIMAFYDNNTITVSSPQDKVKSLKLYDSSGRLHYEYNTAGVNYHQFDTNAKNGIYILKIDTEKGTKSFKFIF